MDRIIELIENFRKDFNGRISLSKLMRLVDFPKVVELVQLAKKIGLFVDLSDPSEMKKHFKNAEPIEFIEPDKLTCFVGPNEKITERVTMKTYYLFYNNTCLVSQRDGDNYIVRIRIKTPSEKWSIKKLDDGTVDFFPIASNYIEVYSGWLVDWLGFNKPDSNSAYISGIWDEMVCNDVEEISNLVYSRTDASVFSEIYFRWFCEEK